MDASGIGARPAERLAAAHVDIVRDVVDELYRRHPEWRERWGLHGIEATTRDTEFHLEFLRAALEEGLPDVFEWYSAWLAGILRARHVPVEAAVESYRILAASIAARAGDAAAAAAAPLLARGEAGLGRGDDVVPGASARAPGPSALELAALLLRGDRAASTGALRRELARGRSLAQAVDELVQPAMAEVGRLWQTNRITVAEEHLASATLQTVLAVLACEEAAETGAGRRAMFACVEGSRHAMGLRSVADGFECAGWDVQYLGADVPTRDLVAHAEGFRPHVLGLAFSLPQHVPVARRAIRAVRDRLGADSPRVLVGGLPVMEFPALATVVGADAAATSVERALEVARE